MSVLYNPVSSVLTPQQKAINFVSINSAVYICGVATAAVALGIIFAFNPSMLHGMIHAMPHFMHNIPSSALSGALSGALIGGGFLTGLGTVILVAKGIKKQNKKRMATLMKKLLKTNGNILDKQKAARKLLPVLKGLVGKAKKTKNYSKENSNQAIDTAILACNTILYKS